MEFGKEDKEIQEQTPAVQAQIDLIRSIRYAVLAGPELWQKDAEGSIMYGFTDADPVKDAVLPALEFSREAAKEGRGGAPKFLTDSDKLMELVQRDIGMDPYGNLVGSFDYMQIFDTTKAYLGREADGHMLEMVREKGAYEWLRNTGRPHYFADNAWIHKDTAYTALAQHGTLQDLQKAMASEKHPEPDVGEGRPLYNVLNQPGKHTVFRHMPSDRIIETQQAINGSPVLSDDEKQLLGKNMILAAEQTGRADMHPERYTRIIQNNRDKLLSLANEDPGILYRQLGEAAMYEQYNLLTQNFETMNNLLYDPLAEQTDESTRRNVMDLTNDLSRTEGFPEQESRPGEIIRPEPEAESESRGSAYYYDEDER